MKFSKLPQPQTKPIHRSSCKQNRSIVANSDKPFHNHPYPSKTTNKKVKHSQFRLFNQLPTPIQLKFDQLQPISTQAVYLYATEQQKMDRSLELIFKLLDSKRKRVLYNDNLNVGKLSQSVRLILSPIFAHASQLQKEEGFSLKQFEEQVVSSGISDQLYQLIFVTEEQKKIRE